MDEWAIATEGISKHFGLNIAVADLNLKVKRGEVFGLVGPDGAGKTTVIRMLCGLIDPTSGQGRVLGLDLAKEVEQIKLEIGYMSQRFSLYKDMTVMENMRFFADIYQVPAGLRDQRINSLLGFTRLRPFYDRLAENLSGGMKQKLALACTVIHQPSLILLDEPTTGVDPVSRREFWDLLREMNRQGTTILVSTPYMDEAERCQRIAFVHNGRILQTSTPMEIRKLMPDEIIEVKAKPKYLAKQAAEGLELIKEVSLFGEKLHLVVDNAQTAIPIVEAKLRENGIEVMEMRQIGASLEDVFLTLIKDKGETAAWTNMP